MVTITVTFKCDECGKEHTEKVVKKKGYEDADYLLSNEDAAYMPEGWVADGDYETLWCPKCAEKDEDDDSNYVA